MNFRTWLAVSAALVVVCPLRAAPQVVERDVGVIQSAPGVLCENLSAPNPFEYLFFSSPEGREEFQRMLEARYPKCPQHTEQQGETR